MCNSEQCSVLLCCAKAVTKEALPPDVFVPHLLASAAPPSCLLVLLLPPAQIGRFFFALCYSTLCCIITVWCTILYHGTLVNCVQLCQGNSCALCSYQVPWCTDCVPSEGLCCTLQEYGALCFMALWYTVLYIRLRGSMVHCAVQERDPGALCSLQYYCSEKLKHDPLARNIV